MDDLEIRRPSNGGSSYYGNPGTDSLSPSDAANALMPFYHQVKNREIQDFKAKAQFANDLQLKQSRLQSTFNPSGNADGSPNVVYQPSPGELEKARADAPISALDQAKLGMERDKLNLDKSNVNNDNTLNERKFGLDQQKNEQIHQNKEDDLQRKSDEATARLKLAHDQLQAKQNDAAAQLAFHQAQQAASDANHKLELSHKDAELNESKRLHDAQIADMQAKLDALQNSTTVSEQNPEKSKITTTTTKGSKSKTVGGNITMVGQDGKSYQVPYDKVDDAQQNGMKFVSAGK